MKILFIAQKETADLYHQVKVPSHWLYGAAEMEQDGHEVIWEQESAAKSNDIRLIRKYHPDIVFIPNLNLHNHLLLLALSALGILRIPIYSYLHRTPAIPHGIKGKIYRFLLKGVSHIFFLSEKTMKETVNSGMVEKNRASVPGWGPDMEFYKKVKTSDNGRFVSTGKENRDFDTLIEAFRITGAPLTIMTAKSHNGANYEDLTLKCKDIPNIDVTITENTGNVFPQMLEAMANAKALVCPLRQDRLTYCVGLSTIADAEGLNKPLIITENPYHNPERTNNFKTVRSVDDWIAAIKEIENQTINLHESKYNMQSAYQSMKSIMFNPSSPK